ncbi:MAG: helix-turn-helix domain-containing protein [Clostridia bacterium]|nr:helix-turn-helix domain-containing protein [Clostridia bacterium]
MLKLRLKRIEKGLTQGELARRVGVSQNALSMCELGVHFPRKKTLDKLAEVLDCKIADLI